MVIVVESDLVQQVSSLGVVLEEKCCRDTARVQPRTRGDSRQSRGSRHGREQGSETGTAHVLYEC